MAGVRLTVYPRDQVALGTIPMAGDDDSWGLRLVRLVDTTAWVSAALSVRVFSCAVTATGGPPTLEVSVYNADFDPRDVGGPPIGGIKIGSVTIPNTVDVDSPVLVTAPMPLATTVIGPCVAVFLRFKPEGASTATGTIDFSVDLIGRSA